MVIECVTLDTLHHFHQGNPIKEQHLLRYRCISQRHDWEIPTIRQMEYDQYDNPATVYFVYRDEQGVARGSLRLYPTDRPFMLQDFFSHFIQYGPMPTGASIYEGSRFCIDHELDSKERARIAQLLVLAYAEYGVDQGLTSILGIMYPAFWRRLFIANGWTPRWLGEEMITPDQKKSRAALLPVSEETLANIRSVTGINTNILNYGDAYAIHV